MSYPPLVPSIAVSDAIKAIEFYKAAFGAVERYRLIDPESRKVGHAELDIHGGLLMLSDEYPQFNRTPHALGGTTVKLSLMSKDANADFEQAVKAGAQVVIPLSDQFYGHRSGRVRDPFGHEWLISQELEKVTPKEMQRRWDSMGGRKGK